MIVVKFGGTSLSGAARMRAAARIVAAHLRTQPVACVVSAMAGVTDSLLSISDLARSGDQRWHELLAELHSRHLETLTALTETIDSRAAYRQRVSAAWHRLEADLHQLLSERFESEEAQGHAVAAFSAWGERLSILLFAAALAAEHIPANPFEGEPIILTGQTETPIDHRAWQGQVCQTPLTPSVEATRDWLKPQIAGLLQEGIVSVLPGYLGRTREGLVTTLGRNGSDYSAAVIGAALHAEAVYIYSDVAGIHRADPRIMPEAQLLPALTYEDAAFIARLGARVLHPDTLLPLAQQGITLHLRSAIAPEAPGTDIGPEHTLGQHSSQQEPWVIAARPLAARQHQPTALDYQPGMVEVIGAFLRKQRGGFLQRISVAVAAAESVTTQRRLYAELARTSRAAYH